ncbi:CRISPR type III-A/MTUBE-associated protein Csm6 [Eubacterium ruminantium]|nr:CRISPR type III-A/MTUBE-associated protein Csm6 [Eubacterium ruminantium]
MGRIILFSPVGGTDPMSQNNFYDGSMIHICRVYKPDIVYLYMSNEMLEFQKADDRYMYCIRKLEERNNHHIEIRMIERPNLTEVQRFDDIYSDFVECIKMITADMREDDKLLLNVSSGTPAMKSSLLVMNVLGEFDFTAVQVSTPEKSINEHTHDGYDVETLWDMNQDNCESFINRCNEVECPALLYQKNVESAKKFIDNYDYSAALEILDNSTNKTIKEYADFILLAKIRLELDFSGVSKLEKKLGVDCTPVKTGDAKKLFEYALTLQIKQKRKQYADFLRAITPLIADLFEAILKKQCGIDIDDYTYFDKKGGRRWSDKKLENNPELKEILQGDSPELVLGYVYSHNIKSIIENKSNDQNLKRIVNDLRTVEDKVRNMAAHQIISVNDDMIRECTGYDSRVIMNTIIAAFDYTGFNIKRDKWNSYDDMNAVIKAKMMI